MYTATALDDRVFDTFLAYLWQGLAAAATPPADGVRDVPARGGFFSCALDRRQRFAAFRWQLPHVEDERLSAGTCDAFCVPSTIGAVRGLRLGYALSSLAEPPRAGSVEASAWVNPAEYMELFAGKAGLSWQKASRPLPGFLELTAVLCGKGNISTSSHAAQLALMDATAELGYYKQLALERDAELKSATQQLKDLRAEALWGASRPQQDEQVARVSPEAENLDALSGWCDAHREQLTVLPRAMNGAKKSLYERPSLVFAGLEFLAGAYRDARLGLISPEALDQALTQTGLRIAGSVAPSIAGAQGDAYFVPWQGRRRFLELHLLRGGGRDERYCLRIYFFWDEATKRCVVGWLPSHLSNSLS